MSISSVSAGGPSPWGVAGAGRQRPPKPPDLTKEQFSQIKEKLQTDGKDTSNIDKILANFDQLDADQDGKISRKEMKAGADQFGIELPKRPDGPPPGPPPGFSLPESASKAGGSQGSNSLLEQILKAFSNSNNNEEEQGQSLINLIA